MSPEGVFSYAEDANNDNREPDGDVPGLHSRRGGDGEAQATLVDHAYREEPDVVCH